MAGASFLAGEPASDGVVGRVEFYRNHILQMERVAKLSAYLMLGNTTGNRKEVLLKSCLDIYFIFSSV